MTYKIPYIESNARETKISANTDLVILDGGTPVLISLVDLGVRVRKIVSDIIISSQTYTSSCVLRDREDTSLKMSLSTWNKSFRYKSEKQGELTHTVIHSNNIDDYCIDWQGEGKSSVIAKWLRTKHFIPVNEKIVNLMIEYQNRKKSSSYYYGTGWIEELSVFTTNPMFETLKAYKINAGYFISLLSNVTLNDYDTSFNWNEIENLEDYILTFTDFIRQKLEENINVLYNPDIIDESMFEGKLKPYKGQIPIIQSGIEVLKKNRSLYIGGEMGIGKTLISTKINHAIFNKKQNKNYMTLVVAPAITLTQWKKEIEDSLDSLVDIFVIRSTVDFIKEYNKPHDKPVYYLVGKETFKLDAKKKAGVIIARRTIKARVKETQSWGYYSSRDIIVNKSVNIEICQCPNCGKPLKNENKTSADYFLSASDFEDKPRKSTYRCGNCNSVLWQSVYDKTRKTSLINYIKVKHILFDSVICDEAHESNNSNSIIGNAIRTVFSHGKKIILLSGTSNNGYSSSMHNILLGLFPRKIVEDGVLKVEDFIMKYGTLQAVSKKEDGVYYRSGRSNIKDSDYVEIEGLNPVVFTKYLAENYIFANLSDLEKDLPDLVEQYIPIIANEDQEKYENKLANEIHDANAFNYKMYQDSIIRHYVNNPYGWNVPISITGAGGITKDIFPTNLKNTILPKEEKLVEICLKEKSEGRKAWIYTDFSGESGEGQYMQGINIPTRLKGILESHGLKVFWLRPNVKPIDRKELIEKNVEKYDIFISNPKLVNVGINLTWCPTYINYIPSYHVNVVSQSSRRGYRANSDMQNRIYYLYYHNSCEKSINERYQRKSLEARAIEGRFNIATENEGFRTASGLSSKIDKALDKKE